ncbi:sulfur transferase domain-containing protein [bacterium]|nr:sulfur transferase domain-containing protein [bacterium]
MHNPWARFAAWLDLLIVDLGLLRLPVNRPVEVAPGIWRSNQPTPWRLKALARRGFRSIINLRGEGHSGAFYLEQYYATQLGLKLCSLKMSSRRPPTVEQLLTLQDWLDNAPKPLLLHCKSGADRAGLAAAICLLSQDQSPDVAARQLSWRYLHIRNAPTGMMDHFVQTYAQSGYLEGVRYRDWVSHQYNRDQTGASFKRSGRLSWLTDRLLRRE